MTPNIPKKQKQSRFFDERLSHEKLSKNRDLGGRSPRINDFFIIDTNENQYIEATQIKASSKYVSPIKNHQYH
jgi:hypothetical protein